MNTTTRRFARYIALPVVSAGIIGGAALGLAGAANAATSTPAQNDQRSSFVATPTVKAHPAPEAQPGWHHGVHRLQDLEPGYTR